MLKRFMIGFVIGVGACYWYIHNYDRAVSDADQWMERSASHYRGDRDHELVESETGRAKP
ncbi:MAG: hypothetical protein ACRERC_13790 [Candidatus Binatia bacterium]